MSDPSDESVPEKDGEGISDEQLPADLRPGDDNPLAEPLADGEEVEGMSAPDSGETP